MGDNEQLKSLQERNWKLSAQAEVNRADRDKLQEEVDQLREQTCTFDGTLAAVNRQACCYTRCWLCRTMR